MIESRPIGQDDDWVDLVPSNPVDRMVEKIFLEDSTIHTLVIGRTDDPDGLNPGRNVALRYRRRIGSQ
jgi:hypothetical protein